jgi:hypothetical protein
MSHLAQIFALFTLGVLTMAANSVLLYVTFRVYNPSRLLSYIHYSYGGLSLLFSFCLMAAAYANIITRNEKSRLPGNNLRLNRRQITTIS